MALIAFPQPKRRQSGSVGAQWRTVSVYDDLSGLPGLVDAVIETGARIRTPDRPVGICVGASARRTVGLIALMTVAAGVVVACRWWRARGRAEHIPPVIAHAPSVQAVSLTGDTKSGVGPASAEAKAAAPPQAEACGLGTQAPQWGVTPPAPARRRDVERPIRAFGRGPSVMPPSIPAARPPLPGRPGLHLPR